VKIAAIWALYQKSGGRYKSCKGDEANIPSLNQVNYVLLNLHMAGNHDAKPTYEELRDWLHSRQVDILRISLK